MSTRAAGRPEQRHLVGRSIKPLRRGSLRNGVGITDQIGELIKSSNASNVLAVTIDKDEVGHTAIGRDIA